MSIDIIDTDINRSLLMTLLPCSQSPTIVGPDDAYCCYGYHTTNATPNVEDPIGMITFLFLFLTQRNECHELMLYKPLLPLDI